MKAADSDDAEPVKVKRLVPESNPFAGLENQIESERERVEREKSEARARARAEAIARDVAKKQAVEEAIRQRSTKKQGAALT